MIIMLIDLHTHIFPEKIAARTIEVLKNGALECSGAHIDNHTDATCGGLTASMRENGVDISVVMPIATRPTQTESINAYARSLNENTRETGVMSFGSVHPAQTDAADILEHLSECGFKGIKLHPEFQDFYIDSPESVRIFKKAEQLGLLVTIHAGADIGKNPPVHCTPERLRNLLGEVSGDNIIAAHMGGWKMWDDVEKYLVGTPVLMDTAFVCDYISDEQYRRIILSHGAEKIIFSSDSPWEPPAYTLKKLLALDLPQEAMNAITCGNARRLLGI